MDPDASSAAAAEAPPSTWDWSLFVRCRWFRASRLLGIRARCWANFKSSSIIFEQGLVVCWIIPFVFLSGRRRGEKEERERQQVWNSFLSVRHWQTDWRAVPARLSARHRQSSSQARKPAWIGAGELASLYRTAGVWPRVHTSGRVIPRVPLIAAISHARLVAGRLQTSGRICCVISGGDFVYTAAHPSSAPHAAYETLAILIIRSPAPHFSIIPPFSHSFLDKKLWLGAHSNATTLLAGIPRRIKRERVFRFLSFLFLSYFSWKRKKKERKKKSRLEGGWTLLLCLGSHFHILIQRIHLFRKKKKVFSPFFSYWNILTLSFSFFFFFTRMWKLLF